MEEAASGKAAETFTDFIANPYLTVICLCAVMAGIMFVGYRGISGGIEKSCKVLMPMLFIIMLLLIARSLTLPGAAAGLRFYLTPDFSKFSAEGLLAAFGQGFYSLSLGMGITITYGSYLSSREYMPSMTRTIIILDTFAAFMAGLVIFPAVFAFGIDAGSGPGLTFVTLPAVFARMPMGEIFSFAFFALLFIAAFTSGIALFEVSVTYAIDELHWTRPMSALVIGAAITLLGVPSALSGGEHIPKIFGMGFLDAMDFITNNAIMPIGGALTSLFVGWVWTQDALDEVTGRGEFRFRFYKAWLWICRLVAPVCITAVFIAGIR